MIYEYVDSEYIIQPILNSNIINSFYEFMDITAAMWIRCEYYYTFENAVGWKFTLRTQRQILENLWVEKPYNDFIFYLEGWWSLLVNFSTTLFLVLSFALYLLTFAGRILGNISSGRDNLLTVYAYFDEWEEELGCLDDTVYYILFLGLTIMWFYFFTIVSAYIITKNINWLIIIFTMVLTSGLIIPGSVVINMGVYCVQYVRGSGRTASIVFEVLLDFISISVIIIRFFIQNIRFVFIFLAFFELYEFSFNVLTPDFSLFSPIDNTLYNKVSESFKKSYDYKLLSYLVMQWVIYLYYLGHLTLLFIVQLSIYFVLSFWLFFFLYTTFILQPHDKYFIYKRLVQ